MAGWLRVAMMAAQMGVVEKGTHLIRRLVMFAAAGIVILFCIVFALVWLDAALWYFCLPRIGPAYAALAAAGAPVVVALLVALTLKLAQPRKPRRAAVVAPPLAVAEAAGREVNNFIRRNPQTTAALALLAGLAISGLQRRR